MTSLDQQIEQIESLARQHYPNDPVARNSFKVEQLMQKLREMHYRFAGLPVKEQTL